MGKLCQFCKKVIPELGKILWCFCSHCMHCGYLGSFQMGHYNYSNHKSRSQPKRFDLAYHWFRLENFKLGRMFHERWNHYRLEAKLREGNVFTGVCLFTGGGYL